MTSITRKNRETKTQVTYFVEADRHTVNCDDHNQSCDFYSKSEALRVMAYPSNFCSECAAIAYAPKVAA